MELKLNVTVSQEKEFEQKYFSVFIPSLKNGDMAGKPIGLIQPNGFI